MNLTVALLVALISQSSDTRAKTEATIEPLRTTIGVRLGPYRPSIDAESNLGANTPYNDFFQDSSGVFISPQVRVLWPVGPFNFGVSLSLGWVSQTTNAFVDTGGEGTPSSTDTESGGETSIRVIPVSVLGVVRFSGFVDWSGLPLVPYAEAGPAYSFWRVGRGSAESPKTGGTLGWQVVGGLALRLDALEPLSAKALFDQFHIRGTELTFEWSHLQADGFGRDDVLHVGDSTWTLGLAVGF